MYHAVLFWSIMPSQAKIILKINHILQNNKTDFFLNREGVCSGLAALFIKYALEDREDVFFRRLEQVNKLPIDYQLGQNSTVDRFLLDIETKVNRQEIEYEFLDKIQGRIVIKTPHSADVSKRIAEVPGVVSTSPTILTGIDMESIRIASDRMEIIGDFGVRVNRSIAHEKTSGEIEKDIGERIQNRTKASVNLRDPNTWVEIDIREKYSFIFSERNRGSGGFPVGSEGALAALISGGIDSPVASYEVMTRGCDITPIYFYNRPIASEDHIARFEEVLRILTKFHPAKRWHYYIVDMEEVNTQLLEIERGRMILHRMVMFRIAEEIAVKNGLNGVSNCDYFILTLKLKK